MPFVAFLSYSVRCLYVFLSGFAVFETPLPPLRSGSCVSCRWKADSSLKNWTVSKFMWTARGLKASKTAYNKGIHITVLLTSRLFCLLKQVITDKVANRHAIKVYINFKFVNLKHNINVFLIRVFPVYMTKKIKTGRNHIIIQMNSLNIDCFSAIHDQNFLCF